MSAKARPWFRFENQASDPTVAEIHIIDVIASWDEDWLARNFGYDMGVTARAFVEQLAALPDAVKSLRVHINSPGGDVQAGINIANALREQQMSKGRTVETVIDGLAASIASVIAMAGQTIRIADNALLMIHNPWSLAIGDAKEMRKTADVLDTMRGQIVNTYKWHSSLENDAIAALMDAETWMNADEAIANGFATEKVEGLQAAASIDPKAVARLQVPDQYRGRVEAFLRRETTQPPAPPPTAAAAVDVVRECKAADCLELVEELLESGATIDQVRAQVASVKHAKAAARERADAIASICATAKLPELAQGYIDGQMTVAAVRAHVTTITAKLDQVEIDTHLNPDRKPAKSPIDVTAVYAERNAKRE